MDKMAMDSCTNPRPPASDVEYWNGVTALIASIQLRKYPLTAPRTIFRRGGYFVPSNKSAEVKSWERVSQGDGLTPWRNGEDRNNWLGASGRYRDSCAANCEAWANSVTDEAALHRARRTSSSRIPYRSSQFHMFTPPLGSGDCSAPLGLEKRELGL